MATNRGDFDWFRREIVDIKSRRFHIFKEVSETALVYKGVPTKGAFADFIREFGWALLYTDSRDVPLVSVYPLSTERLFSCKGNTLIGFGYRGLESAFLSEVNVLEGTDSPVFKITGGMAVIRNENFESWFFESCDWAKRRFSAKAWARILSGPMPFSPRELKVAAARKMFSWKHTGFAVNGDAIFEVENKSDLRLPYLTIGVQGKGGTKLVGGAWLKVSGIAPGTKGFVSQDCYKDILQPDELEVFQLEEPIAEKKEFYWEFKKNLAQTEN
jgi:hypothetical protein